MSTRRSTSGNGWTRHVTLMGIAINTYATHPATRASKRRCEVRRGEAR